MCPFRPELCGRNKTIEFNNPGERISLMARTRADGNICTYRIKAKCGAPGFKIRNGTNATAGHSEIVFTEFDEDLGRFDRPVSNLSTGINERRNMSADRQMPPRDMKFANQGVSDQVGQRKPPLVGRDGQRQNPVDMGNHYGQQKAEDDDNFKPERGGGQPTKGKVPM